VLAAVLTGRLHGDRQLSCVQDQASCNERLTVMEPLQGCWVQLGAHARRHAGSDGFLPEDADTWGPWDLWQLLQVPQAGVGPTDLWQATYTNCTA
jgi:hypothetical protein